MYFGTGEDDVSRGHRYHHRRHAGEGPYALKLSNTPPPSSRTRLFSKSLIWLEKSVIRDLLAAAANQKWSYQSADANRSRIARFANEIEDFGQTGFRDDDGCVGGGRSMLAHMGGGRHPSALATGPVAASRLRGCLWPAEPSATISWGLPSSCVKTADGVRAEARMESRPPPG